MSEQPSPSSKFQPEPPPGGAPEVRLRHEANRLSWNQGAAAYTAELQETIDFLRSGKSSLHPIERRNLGDLREWCRSAIHLQCASGRDTLSLWIEGVERVVGVDISDVHIANARQASQALGAPAEWYRCDVLDTPHELDGSFDLVYTGRGALCWLHDLGAWGRVVHRLLKPGGKFHVLDDHPASWMFDQESETLQPSGVPYFGYWESSRGWPDSYLGDLGLPAEQHLTKYEHLWTLAEIHQALTGAGLAVELLGEYPDEYWDGFPWLKPELHGVFPMTFAMMGRRPA
jgi:SAM-dependent methyltransferase